MESKNYVPRIFLSSFIKIQYTTVSESNAFPRVITGLGFALPRKLRTRESHTFLYSRVIYY